MMTDTTAIPNHHRESAHRNIAPTTAIGLIIFMSSTIPTLISRLSGRPFAIPIIARAVNAGGPTFMNKPARCSRFGMPEVL